MSDGAGELSRPDPAPPRRRCRVARRPAGVLIASLAVWLWPRPASLAELNDAGLEAFGPRPAWPGWIPAAVRSRLPDRRREAKRLRVRWPLTPVGERRPWVLIEGLRSPNPDPAALKRLEALPPLPPPKYTKEEALRRLPAFREIELLFYEDGASDLAALLAGQDRLRELAIRDSALGDAAVVGLASPTLERLEVVRGVRGAFIDRLGPLPRLNHLGVAGWMAADRWGDVPGWDDASLWDHLPEAVEAAGGDPTVVRAELMRPVAADFSRFPNLRSAVLGGLPLDGRSIESLADCPKLVSVELTALPNVPAASIVRFIERSGLVRMKVGIGINIDAPVVRAARKRRLQVSGRGWPVGSP